MCYKVNLFFIERRCDEKSFKLSSRNFGRLAPMYGRLVLDVNRVRGVKNPVLVLEVGSDQLHLRRSNILTGRFKTTKETLLKRTHP